MLESMRSSSDAANLISISTTSSSTMSMESGNDEPQGPGNVICTHDGVLLKKASAEHINEMNTSGALSLVEYAQPKRLYLEWRPNENILIADESQDQEDWALVDTISRRTRTVSECKAFNTKPAETGAAAIQKPHIIRTKLDELSRLRVISRGQTLRFIRKADDTTHSEYFFQHGNAELFVNSMCKAHLIDSTHATNIGRNVEEYIILTQETQKLKKTFAELDIGEIKSSNFGHGNWQNRVVGFLANIPDYVAPPLHRGSNNKSPLIHGERVKSPVTAAVVDNYQMLGFGESNGNSASGSQSRTSSVDKTQESDVENLKEIDEKIVNTLPDRVIVVRGAPLNEKQWLEFQTTDGRISDAQRVREIIFRGGIVPHLRADVWKYLLNYYAWSDTEVERVQRRNTKSKEYYAMKAQWLSMTTTQEANFSGYRDRKCQIDKDVKRTDRSQEFFSGENNPNLKVLEGILMTYVMYNFDLGYVQGMSDLLAPILAIEGNEVDAFWCFVGFMDMVFANFDMDQAGMKTQFQQLRCILEFANPRLFNYMLTNESDNMYFCFRWLLVWYKREFSNDDILKLWECLWTRLPCPNFHIFISVAILDQQSDAIVENRYEFTGILKHINELSGQIDVKRTLELAEAIYLQIKAADNLPNEIREIIGEPLLEDGSSPDNSQTDFDDGFDELVTELTPEEQRHRQEQLEEACERSMFMNFT